MAPVCYIWGYVLQSISLKSNNTLAIQSVLK